MSTHLFFRSSTIYLVVFALIGLVWSIQPAHAERALNEFVQFTGEAANDYADISASAGDVDGDGFDDFLIGSYENDEAGYRAGAAYLIYGSSEPLVSASLSTAVKFTGETEYSSAGISVASAGDVNNDGYDDILIGANGAQNGFGLYTGSAYLLYGSAIRYSGVNSLSIAVKFVGEVESDSAGSAVSSAGDVNGDSYDDMLVGARNNDDSAGAVYLIYGGAVQYNGAYSLSEQVEFFGENANDRVGYAVSSAGDVNGDSYDDVLVGAEGNDQAGSYSGAAYLIYGSSEPLVSASLSTAVKFTGEAASDAAGYSLSSAGDVNGDSYDDMLVGGFNNANSTGAAYLIYGSSEPLVSASLSTAVKFTGEAEDDYAGFAVSSAGDVNGDSYDDMLVGANGSDVGGNLSGIAYLIYGSATQYVGVRSLGEMYTLLGEAGERVGNAVSSAGDVDGDGFDDILVGSEFNDAGAINAGAVYLMYAYIDADHDGYTGSMGILSGPDCNDADETASFIINWYQDFDDDTLGNPEVSIMACESDNPSGYSLNDHDLGDNDHDNDGYNTDVDCDDDNEDSVPFIYYADSDFDGLGNSEEREFTCVEGAPSGYITDFLDSNDNDFDNDSVEGSTWGGSDCNDTDASLTANLTYYADTDADTLGDPSSSVSVCSLTVPTGYVSNNTDVAGEVEEVVVAPVEETAPEEILEETVTDESIEEATVTEDTGTGTLEDPITDAQNPETVEIITPEELSDPEVVAANLSTVSGAAAGSILVTYTDSSVYSYPVFAISSSKVTKVLQYQDTAYILVLHPNGKKIALVNPYTGEVIKRIVLSKKIKYTKNAMKTLDVRHDGSVDIIVTSKKKGKVKVSLLTLNTSTSTLKKKDSISLTGEKKVVVTKTKAPKKKITLRNKNGKVQATIKVNSSYQLSNKPE